MFMVAKGLVCVSIENGLNDPKDVESGHEREHETELCMLQMG